MDFDEILRLRKEINDLLLKRLRQAGEKEFFMISEASEQLAQFGCRGGSARAKAEREIIRLVTRFDDAEPADTKPWPVSKFMRDHTGASDKLKMVLKGCISAHKTGRYEPMVAAIAAAENLLEDQAQ